MASVVFTTTRCSGFSLAVVYLKKMASSESQKKIDLDFTPIFNYNKLSTRKQDLSKVCTKSNCASNGVKIILYFSHSWNFI
jgi:hypothetical protein